MTREEKRLYYDGLKKLPWKFRRQVFIENYIVDFCCPELKIVVEVNGTQHFLEDDFVYDRERDEILRGAGLIVLRHSNADINRRFENVVEDIYSHCDRRNRERKCPTAIES